MSETAFTPPICARLDGWQGDMPAALKADLSEASAIIKVLESAAQRIEEQLWTTHGSNNREALVACLKETERINSAALTKATGQ